MAAFPRDDDESQEATEHGKTQLEGRLNTEESWSKDYSNSVKSISSQNETYGEGGDGGDGGEGGDGGDGGDGGEEGKGVGSVIVVTTIILPDAV